MVDTTMHRWVNYLRQIRRDKKETNSSTSKIQKKPKTRGTRRESPKLYIENIHQRFDKLKKKTNISIVKIFRQKEVVVNPPNFISKIPSQDGEVSMVLTSRFLDISTGKSHRPSRLDPVSTKETGREIEGCRG